MWYYNKYGCCKGHTFGKARTMQVDASKSARESSGEDYSSLRRYPAQWEE